MMMHGLANFKFKSLYACPWRSIDDWIVGFSWNSTHGFHFSL